MKYAIGAVAAVALGLSMAVSAQAQTPPPQTNQKQANATHAISQKEKIKHAQQALKEEGLYKGKIDGIWGHGSRQALMQFEKRNNLPASGKLDSKNFAALTRNATPASVGSSTPRQQGSQHATPGQMPATGAGGNDGASGAASGAGGAKY